MRNWVFEPTKFFLDFISSCHRSTLLQVIPCKIYVPTRIYDLTDRLENYKFTWLCQKLIQMKKWPLLWSASWLDGHGQEPGRRVAIRRLLYPALCYFRQAFSWNLICDYMWLPSSPAVPCHDKGHEQALLPEIEIYVPTWNWNLCIDKNEKFEVPSRAQFRLLKVNKHLSEFLSIST